MAKMSGSEVRQSLSITMPPRITDVQAASASQLIARPNASGEHHDIRFERAAVSEVQAMTALLAVDDGASVLLPV